MLRSSSPCFTQDACRNNRGQPADERGSMQRPQQTVISLRRHQCACVISKAVHAQALRALRRTPSKRSRSASPAARSSGDRSPASASHSSTPRRPSRWRSRRSAAAESHAEKETPSSSAARSTASATVSSSDTERLVTPMASMVAPLVVPTTTPKPCDKDGPQVVEKEGLMR